MKVNVSSIGVGGKLLISTLVAGTVLGIIKSAPRIETYKELAENNVDPTEYIGNYGQAKVALDSVRTYNTCKEMGLNPVSVEDAEYQIDSALLRKYGYEPYGRDADDFDKALARGNITIGQLDEICAQNEEMKQEVLKLIEELALECPPIENK